MLMPPEMKSTSCRRLDSIALRIVCGSSRAIPRSVASHPHFRSSARSIGVLELRICEPIGAALSGTNSSPVARTATRGRGWTCGS
jgi:hypothetical protein